MCLFSLYFYGYVHVYVYVYVYVYECMYKPWSAPSMKTLSIDAMWFGSGLWGRLYVPGSTAKAWRRR